MCDSPEERWLPIPGYDGKYEVSDLGRLRSWYSRNRSSQSSASSPRILSPTVDRYLTIHLYRNGLYKIWNVHRLVITTFSGPCPEGMEIRHVNGNAHDCRLSNLAYGTHSENIRDAVRQRTHHHSRQTHCKRGHEFTSENTRIGVTRIGNPQRNCRICERIRGRRNSAPQREKVLSGG